MRRSNWKNNAVCFPVSTCRNFGIHCWRRVAVCSSNVAIFFDEALGLSVRHVLVVVRVFLDESVTSVTELRGLLSVRIVDRPKLFGLGIGQLQCFPQ